MYFPDSKLRKNQWTEFSPVGICIQEVSTIWSEDQTWRIEHKVDFFLQLL